MALRKAGIASRMGAPSVRPNSNDPPPSPTNRPCDGRDRAGCRRWRRADRWAGCGTSGRWARRYRHAPAGRRAGGRHGPDRDADHRIDDHTGHRVGQVEQVLESLPARSGGPRARRRGPRRQPVARDPPTATRAAPSSPRSVLPHTSSRTGRGPSGGRRSSSLDAQVQEVGRARDAGVVAPDELLEPERRLVVRQVRGRTARRRSGRPRWRPGSGSSAARSGRSRCGPARPARSDGTAGRAAPRSPRRRPRAQASTARRPVAAAGSRR